LQMLHFKSFFCFFLFSIVICCVVLCRPDKQIKLFSLANKIDKPFMISKIMLLPYHLVFHFNWKKFQNLYCCFKWLSINAAITKDVDSDGIFYGCCI
jgi:hypothetical protein